MLLQFPLRVALGGAFAFAAYNKLGALQSFADAIKGFRIIDAEQYGYLILIAAHTLPWVEMIAGGLLVLGLWSRASAAVIAMLLLGFIGALIHVILDGTIHADCSCFGDLTLVCPKGVGWCQVVRNVVLLIPALYLVWRQGGRLGLDALWVPRGEGAGSGGIDPDGERA